MNLPVEIKGYRREDAKEKKAVMETCWAPGVNNHNCDGPWVFAGFTDGFRAKVAFAGLVKRFRATAGGEDRVEEQQRATWPGAPKVIQENR